MPWSSQKNGSCKYWDFRLQVLKLWNVKAAAVLEMFGDELEEHQKSIGILIVISFLPKGALLGTDFIFRRVL